MVPPETLPDLEGAKSGVYEVLLRNRQWAEKQRRKNEGYFRPLSEGQKPKYFVICCSDSRCPSEKVMGFHPVTHSFVLPSSLFHQDLWNFVMRSLFEIML